MEKKKKTLGLVLIIIAVILAGLAGSFFYWQKNSQKSSLPEPPRLFSKNDYKIEERAGEKYIIVKKVGLEAKVPTGWTIEFEGSDYPEPEYWVHLLSPQAKIENTLIKNGCGISIMIGENQEAVDEAKGKLDLIARGINVNEETRPEYQLTFVQTTLGGYKALGWSTYGNDILGKSTGIILPLSSKDELIDININFSLDFKEICQPIWQEFINSVKID